MFDAANDAHRRYNPLNGTHVLVSPHRMNRPWNGQVEEARGVDLPVYDPSCHLCPGNKRVGGEVNPPYSGTISFPNDYPAVLPPSPLSPSPLSPSPLTPSQKPHALFAAHPVSGRCRVVCFHPRHDLTLSRMSIPEIEAVIRAWRDIYHEQGKMLLHSGGGYVQIFEEDAGLATVLKSLLVAYDNLFTTPFPYSMGIHQSPHPLNPASHLHFHFYPPLLRSASVRKFVVGFEMLAEAQRDLTPEAAAEQLRALPKTHYAEG
ncbi:uncharacterized protein CcaverHIS019_0104930 [Cutaneotrichosporon cavernicola]|uniref:Galactose-1-phosphate uridylyltransferase n=1 Tax=Cutaneotrichosporon cavernicola TaxID=279322 RepID=A0AA48I4L5_9TREE|nr:uncharacterized protein CcaverHIS019_0104930 [Cutaneotrichosporon cavernicola]BEI87775.1 hypothetical protein CcaverHIS019_0104930 [Cutaneotrichosporon cavernicola]